MSTSSLSGMKSDSELRGHFLGGRSRTAQAEGRRIERFKGFSDVNVGTVTNFQAVAYNRGLSPSGSGISTPWPWTLISRFIPL